jgi:putative membrane protein
MENLPSENIRVEQRFNKFIIAISILIPVVVAILFGVKLKDFGYNVEPLSFLPPIYATINGITAIVLVLALRHQKRKSPAARAFDDHRN